MQQVLLQRRMLLITVHFLRCRTLAAITMLTLLLWQQMQQTVLMSVTRMLRFQMSHQPALLAVEVQPTAPASTLWRQRASMLATSTMRPDTLMLSPTLNLTHLLQRVLHRALTGIIIPRWFTPSDMAFHTLIMNRTLRALRLQIQ